MTIRYKTILATGITCLLLASCNDSDKSQVPQEDAAAESTEVRQLDSPSIIQYPVLFSSKTEELRLDLLSKAKTDLNTAEKEIYFPKNSDTKVIFDDAYQVFPLNKMTHAKSAVVIYLAKKIKGAYPYEGDRIVLVMYNRESQPVSTCNISLQDAAKNKELNLLSLISFEVINTDQENDSKDEPAITRSMYEIDTVKLQFKQIK